MLSTSKTTDRPLSRPATAAQLRHASRNLPRYTSYPTALAFQPGEGAAAPVDWFAAMLLKDTTNRYLFSDPQSMVAPRVWAKPVVPSQTQTQGRFTAGAFNLGAMIWDNEDATVRVSEHHASFFVQGMVAIVAEERTALTVFRTTAFVYGPTSHAG